MEKPDTKKGTRRKRGSLSPVEIVSKRNKRSCRDSYNGDRRNITHIGNIYNFDSTKTDDVLPWYEYELSEEDSSPDKNDETYELPVSRDVMRKARKKQKKSISTRKRKREEIEKEKKERKRAEEKEVKKNEKEKKKLQRKTQKAISNQEGEELKAKLNITKSYKQLSSENKEIALKACRAILKNVVKNVGEERETKGLKYDCIQNLTFPEVGTTSDAIVEEILKWYNKLLNDRSCESVKLRKFIMGIFSQVIGRSEVNKLFKENGITDYQAKYKWYHEAKMDADNFLGGGILANYDENVNRFYSQSSLQTPTNSQTTNKRTNKTNIATEEQLQHYNQWHIVALRKLIESDTYKRLQEENKAARTVKILHPVRQDQHECSDECRNQCEKSKQALQIVEDNFPRGWAVRDLKSPLGSNFVTHKKEGIWDSLRDEVESLFKVGKEMQAAQMHDDLSSKVLCPWLTLPSCRELHNEISALAKKKAVEELDTEH